MASSAGGLSVMMAELGGVIADCNFLANTGAPPGSSSGGSGLQLPPQQVADAACSRDTAGGGGGACVFLRSGVAITGGSFVNNTALSGGALFVQQRCMPGDDNCGLLLLSGGTALVSNTALRGGGGALFQLTANLTNVTCAGGTVLLAGTKLARGCSEWVNNTGTYGNVAATRAYRLHLLNPAAGVVAPYRSNDPLQLEVALLDFYGQPVSGASSDASTDLDAWCESANNNTASLAGNGVSAVRGVANFTPSLRLQARPGNYTLFVEAPWAALPLEPVALRVTVRPCIRGEVTNMARDQCFPCQPGTFSLNPVNFVCDACPPNANCSAPDLPWATLPLDGYWTSGAYSPNVLECPIPKACAGNATWSRQGLMLSYLEALDNGTVQYNRGTHLGLQCAYGYYGAMCGRCVSGYGKRSSGECVPCASRLVNVFYYILSTGVNIISIGFTVWMQLPNSLGSVQGGSGEEEEEQEDKEGDEKEGGKAKEGASGPDGGSAGATRPAGQRPPPPPPIPPLPPPPPPPVPAPSSIDGPGTTDPDDAAVTGQEPPFTATAGLGAVAADVAEAKSLPPDTTLRPALDHATPSLSPLQALRRKPVTAAAAAGDAAGEETFKDDPRHSPIRLPPLLGFSVTPQTLASQTPLPSPPAPATTFAGTASASTTQRLQRPCSPRSPQPSQSQQPLQPQMQRLLAWTEEQAQQPAQGYELGASSAVAAAPLCGGLSQDAPNGPSAFAVVIKPAGTANNAAPDAGGGRVLGLGPQPNSCRAGGEGLDGARAGGDISDGGSADDGGREGLGARGNERVTQARISGRGPEAVKAEGVGSKEDEEKDQEYENEEAEEAKVPYKGGNHAIVLKILMSYLQVTSLVRQIAIQWPSFILGWLAAAKSASQTVTTIVSIDCSLDESHLPLSIQLSGAGPAG